MNQVKKYFPALTGVRALAAYLVFFYHFPPVSQTHWPKLWGVFHEGHLGVTIFFVLSGFLICLRYIDRLDLSAYWFTTYVRNRVARIYPMYFLVTSTAFVAMQFFSAGYGMATPWQSYKWPFKLLVLGLNFTFLKGYFQEFVFSGIMQGWTLTVEECFYLLAPLLLLGLHARKKPWGLLLLYGNVSLMIGVLCVRLMPHWHGLFNSYTFMLGFTFFGRSTEFMVGIGLALIIRQFPYFPTIFPIRTAAGLLVMGICWAGLVLVNQPQDAELGTTTNPIGILLNNVLLPLGIACFFAGLIYERSWLRWLLETRVFDLLGKSSYAFYLIHMSTFSQIIATQITQSVFLLFALLVLLSIMLFWFIEEPLHRILTSRAKKSPISSNQLVYSNSAGPLTE